MPRVFEDNSKWSKKVVIPNQSMTLSEILRRFVKREPLPVSQEGIYHEGEYDLEKLAKEDFVVKDEVLDEVKKTVARRKKVAEDMIAAAKAPKEPVIPKPVDPKDIPPQ